MKTNSPRVMALALVLLMVLPALLMTVPVGAEEEHAGPNSRDPINPVKKWTFIVFLFADSSQHGGTLTSYYNMVKNMETKGGFSDDNVNVLVLMDRHPVHAPDKDGDTHAYYVREGKGNSDEIALNEIYYEWVNEVDMGSRYTLKHFGTYAIENYPAQHYVLITRSAGWWPDNFGDDETSHDNLNPFEMRSTLAELSTLAGKKIDVLNIAGCTSGMFEWAYDYYPFVDYYVGTETYSIGSNWRIYYWINDLRKDPNMSVEDFTKIIPAEYVNEDRSGFNPYDTLTASSTNLSHIKDVAGSIDKMAKALKADLRENIHRIWMARDQTPEIDNYLRVDTWEIAHQISLEFPPGHPVHEAALEVMDGFEAMMVANEWHNGIEGWGINVSSAKGLSLYFVRDRENHQWNTVEAYRARLHFSLETHWLDFLDEYFSYIHKKVAYPTGDAFIEVYAGSGDMDGDGYNDDIYVEVWNSDGEILREASVYVNGEFWGKTGNEGWLGSYNNPMGDYIITAIYGEYSATTGVHCEGAGPGYQIILEATGTDLDGDGWKDDLEIWLHDSDLNPIPWVPLYSGRGLFGWTGADGRFWAFDLEEGTYLIMAQVGEGFLAFEMVYSEGQGDNMVILEPLVIDYSNNGEVNDLDLHVKDYEDNGLTGAIVYVDDGYVGESYDGRILVEDIPDGWHWADVYYKEAKEPNDAFFKDVYVRLADLDGDNLEETASIYYDVDIDEAAMDVKVTDQVLLWNDGTLRGISYDNFTVVRGHEDYRYMNYTTDKTRFINITLTLMDKNGYIEDRWSLTGIWLEATQNVAPEARLFVRPTYTYVDDLVGFNGTTSSDSDGNVTSYLFDFGDGTTSGWIADPLANHAYAEAGNYTASLMVMDDRGAMDEKSNRVTVWVRNRPDNIPPTARLFVRPTYTYPWEIVSLNGSTSDDEDGSITSYMFNFGDGTVSDWTNSSTVEHVYHMPGNYTVKLKVQDDDGALSDWGNKITVWVREDVGNDPPHAYFTARPSKVKVNESVTFNATGSSDKDGMIYMYLFDFGDGTDSGWIYESVVTHVYRSSGYYTASLMVEDDMEARSELGTPRGIDVNDNVQPRPYLFSRPHYIDIGQVAMFNASQSWDDDGKVVLYLFDFGDGTNSGWTSEAVLVHSYSKSGNYTIVLYVQDDKGGISTSSSRSTITVRPAKETSMLESPAITVLVIAIFVALMIAGAWYELKKVRLKSYEVPQDGGVVGFSEDEGKEDAEDTGPPGPPLGERKGLKSNSMHGELESGDGYPEDGEDQGPDDGPEATPRRDMPSKSVGGELEAQDEPHQSTQEPGAAGANYVKVRCSGCNGIIRVKKGPRPIRLRCKSCGKRGMLR